MRKPPGCSRSNCWRDKAPGVLAGLRPGVHDVRGVCQRHCRLVQALPPLREVLFHLARAVPEIVARPDCVFLQIPVQFLGLDGADGRDETPALHAVHVGLTRRRRFMDEPGTGGRAAHTVLLVELQVGELEHEFLDRLGLGLGRGRDVSGIAFAERNEDRIHRGFDAARIAAHRDVHRLLAEEFLQHAELSAIQRERDDRELVLA